MKDEKYSKAQLQEMINKLRRENQSLKHTLEKSKNEPSANPAENADSEEKYKALFNNNHSVMLLINPKNGKIIDANPAAEKFYGWNKITLLTKNITEINILTPDEIKTEMNNAREQKRNHFFFKHRIATGEIKEVEVFSGPINIEGEQLLYSIVHDLTEKRQYEAALFYERSLLRTLIDNVPDIIFAKDNYARKTLANKTDLKLMGVKSEREALGKDDFAFYPSERAKEFIEEDKKVIKSGEPSLNTEGHHIDAEGKWHWYITSKYPLRNEEGKIIGLAGIGRDITEHKLKELETERRLENTYEQQSASLKISSHPSIIKGDLLASARIITEIASKVTNVERVSIWLFNESKNEIKCLDLYELSKKKHSDGMVIEVKDYPNYFKSLEAGECIDAANAQTDPRTIEFTNSYLKQLNIASMLDAPIFIEGQIIGVICLDHLLYQRTWEPSEIIFSSDIANHFALAVTNSKKRKAELELRKHLDMQTKLVSLLQSNVNTVQEFLDLALEEAIQITESKIGYIYHYDEEKKELILNFGSREEMKEYGIPESKVVDHLEKIGVWEETVHQRKEIIINDFQAFNQLKKGFPQGDVGLQNFLTVPFSLGDEIVAVIGVGNKWIDYDESDVMNLKVLMNSIWGKVISIQAESALKESEKKYRNLVDNSIIGVYRTTIDGKLLYVNNALADILDYESPAEMMKIPVINAYKDPLQREQFLQKMLTEKVVREFEAVLITKNGAEKTLLLNAVINDDIIDGSLIDITERKKTENELNSYFTNALDLFCIANTDGYFLRLNKQWESLLGYKLDDLEGKRFLDFIHPEDISATLEAVSRLDQQLEVLNFVNRYRTQDNNYRVIEWRAYPNGKLIFAAARDITERIETEEALRKSEMNLKKLNEEKDKFFSIISHDLRSPFLGFINLTELMADNIRNFTLDQLTSISKEMNNSARNLYKMLRNLLDWSMMKQGVMSFSPRTFQLCEFFNHTIETQNQKLSQKEQTVFNQIENQILISADEKMAESLFLNLLSNAIKFTPRGGSIYLKAHPVENKMIEISVNDTGIGMSEDLLQKLFKVAEKVGRKGTDGEDSTSLGLILCKEFIEKHGGKIWVESKVDVGSTFYFTLPAG